MAFYCTASLQFGIQGLVRDAKRIEFSANTWQPICCARNFLQVSGRFSHRVHGTLDPVLAPGIKCDPFARHSVKVTQCRTSRYFLLEGFQYPTTGQVCSTLSRKIWRRSRDRARNVFCDSGFLVAPDSTFQKCQERKHEQSSQQGLQDNRLRQGALQCTKESSCSHVSGVPHP